MIRLVAIGIAGMALGAAATAGAVAEFRIVTLCYKATSRRLLAPISSCHVRSEQPTRPYTNASVECGETKRRARQLRHRHQRRHGVHRPLG